MTISNNSHADHFKHLPHYPALQEYDHSNWICFGGLSYKYPTAIKTQLAHFRTLMDTLGSLNGSFGRRLHWVVRVEKHKSGEYHLHFLLGGHKVTDGNKHKFTPQQACDFLHKNWEYGAREVKVCDPKKDGLGYILKCHPDGRDRDDAVEISPALTTFLKKRKEDPYYGRDSLAVEIIQMLRAQGCPACFGDEIESFRKKSAA